MATLIAGSIDLEKIDRDRLREGRYLDLLMEVSDTVDSYKNNVYICEGQTKEERTSNAKKRNLGNGRVFYTNGKVTVAPKIEKK
jgi:hypothetical protein